MEDRRVGSISCMRALSLVKMGAFVLWVTGGNSMMSWFFSLRALADWTSWDSPVVVAVAVAVE